MTRARRTLKLPKLKLPPGSKVLKIKLPEPEIDHEPGPRLICKGVVLGRAVPWQAYTTDLYKASESRKRNYKRFKEWQATVAAQARLDMGRRRPYGGPVTWRATFYLRPNGRTKPDASNIGKAFEDSLQKIVYMNDTQVDLPMPERIMSATEPQRVEYEVWAK